MSERDKREADESPPRKHKDKPANAAPDAVKDPSEKTEGKPGEAGGKGGEADPGGG